MDLVGPLWVAVHHRHAETMPQLAPYVSDDETWRVRAELYEELLAKPDTLLLLAFVGEAAVGYGLAHVMPVETVDPRHLGRPGHGSAKSNRSVCYRNTAAAGWAPNCSTDSSGTCTTIGVKDLILGALPGNTDAIRLYERRGYRPTWLYLSRFRGAELT